MDVCLFFLFVEKQSLFSRGFLEILVEEWSFFLYNRDRGETVEKQKIKEVIIVEGHSDTAKLKSLVDCETIETSGSALDEQTLDLIALAAKHSGIIVFTDPDYPGMQIRDKISKRVPSCKHAFVAKKDAIGKGKVGIAEAKPEAIMQALKDAASFHDQQETLTWQEFIALDIIGSQTRRLYLYDYFKLGYGNAKTLFKRLNMLGVRQADVLEALKEEGQ